jgi:aminopeptidase N
VLGWEDSIAVFPTYLSGTSGHVNGVAGLPAPQYVLASGEGVGYGLFTLDSTARGFLLGQLESIADPTTRAVAWVTLWDDLLEGHTTADRFLDRALTALAVEEDELVAQRVLGYLETAYWRFSTDEQRRAIASRIETLLWDLLERAPSTSLKATYFNSYISLALTEPGVDRMRRVWSKELEIAGLPLAERQYTALAQELAIRDVAAAEDILTEQGQRIENPDRKARYEFVLPALSTNPAVREAFFESLKDPANREREPWVLAGVSFLHHPLRTTDAEQFILPSLELLQEIQATGDIFFPKRWLDATLGGHASPSAAAVVRDFLRSQRRYPHRLRLKILQSADLLFRAAGTRQ